MSMKHVAEIVSVDPQLLYGKAERAAYGREKYLPQTLQPNFFSFVWLVICRVRCSCRLKDLEQILQVFHGKAWASCCKVDVAASTSAMSPPSQLLSICDLMLLANQKPSRSPRRHMPKARGNVS
jgi:hypothetical protein